MIETDRLLLRKIDPGRDFEAWARTMADEETVRYLGTKPMSRAEAWRSMALVLGHWEIRGYGSFSLELKKTGEWVGRVGPWFPEGWPAREVGWIISPGHLGKGYATEAASASIEHAFHSLGWPRVIHVILPSNTASQRVAEKVGSKLLRTQQGVPGVTDEEVLIYGQSHD